MNGLQAVEIVADCITGAVWMAGMALTCLAAAGWFVAGLIQVIQRLARFGAG